LAENSRKKLLVEINKLVSRHVEDEEELANIYDLLCRHIEVTNKAEKTAVARLNDPGFKRKIIAIDFDGVIHSWVPGSYKGDSTEVHNPPIPGAIKWLSLLANDNRFFVTIYSARSKVLGFDEACRNWLRDNGMTQETINKISVSATKPPAFLFIDDRSWKFNGKFPNPDDILTFKAWHEKSSSKE
jgi:hypothetical protein